MTVPAPTSTQLRTVKPNDLNLNEVYSGEQVIALLDAALNSKAVIERGGRTLENEKKLESKMPRKRNFYPQYNGNDGC